MANSSDDDLPQLEDFEEKFTKIRSKPSNENDDYIGDYTKPKEEYKESEIIEEQKNEKQKKQEDKGLFGGFKKGFLSGQQQQQKKKLVQKQNDNEQNKEIIEYVKPKEPSKNPLEIKQVQEQMQINNNAILKDQKSWLTQDLIEKLMKNPRLLTLFIDPKYSDFMKLIQSNPKEAQEKYGNIPEFNELFKEFCTVMSGHFQGLASSQQQQQQTSSIINTSQQSQEEKIQQLVQNDPEVQEILKDPEIMKIIQMLQKYQKIDFHRFIIIILNINSIMQKNDIIAKKLRILISKGLLNIQGA